MHNTRKINDDIYYLGASDRRIELFENVYPVSQGMSYNSYLITDEKTCLMDSVDESVRGQFLENLQYALNGRNLDYMVVQHMEPDHCSIVPELFRMYPDMKLVASLQAFKMMENFYSLQTEERRLVVKEGDTLKLGKHTLKFIAAPMVHWPEVLMTYDVTDKILFSADAFGSFGAMSGNIFADEIDWDKDFKDEARRYYVNIVGKYGLQTQNVLKKASTLDIQMICPLHAHIWRKDLSTIISLYDTWSKYEAEKDSVVIFYGSIYGNTQNAAEILAMQLAENGIENVEVFDTSKTHVSFLVSKAFEYKTLVFAAATYNAEIFDTVQNLITELKNHNLSNRRIGLIENGSWAPVAASKMKAQLETFKNMEVVEPVVKVVSSVTDKNVEELSVLAKELMK
ncbi:MAG: flavodoxin domain-containing protein [Bulleidia sp.]|nr:FprA family A-type flavoprotein [Erysipelotrichaceae bacterium]MDY2781092.1 flavodoxin domain-containing protein [Bulleidia sp.]